MPPTSPAGPEGELSQDTGPKTTPQTDPTNPFHQEAVGEWVAAEEAAVRKEDEPGMTDYDRMLRAGQDAVLPAE